MVPASARVAVRAEEALHRSAIASGDGKRERWFGGRRHVVAAAPEQLGLHAQHVHAIATGLVHQPRGSVRARHEVERVRRVAGLAEEIEKDGERRTVAAVGLGGNGETLPVAELDGVADGAGFGCGEISGFAKRQ